MDKQALRDEVWAAIGRAGVGRFPGIEGRIPNFVGAEAAARRLSGTDAWRAARVVKANPDSPQWPVRTLALEQGKTVYMAVPRLAEARPFWRLDPDRLEVSAREACSIKGASRHGRPVGLEEMERIDLVVCGSVAVDRSGARLGKGGGYSDLEFGLAVEVGLIGPWTATSTTVHPVQLLRKGRIPMAPHDFPVEVIAGPEAAEAVRSPHPRPAGVLWGELTEERMASIPVLERMRGR